MMVEFVNHKKAASIWDGVCKEFCGPCLSSIVRFLVGPVAERGGVGGSV